MSDIIIEKQDNLPAPEPICTNTVVMDITLMKRVNKRHRYLSLIVAGAVGCLIYIVLSVVLGVMQERTPIPSYESLTVALDVFLWVMAFLFAFGLVLLIVTHINGRNTARLGRTNVFRFYEHSFTVTDLKEGEDMGTVKAYYSDLAKVRENKEFFLLYPNSVTFYPVDKTQMTQEEIEALRAVLPRKR